MKRLFEALTLKFETPNWARSPVFGLLDTILEQHPEFILMMKDDICAGCATSNFGRKDTPGVEQIVRAALFKELKGITYEELAFQQDDSNICRLFLKLEIGDEYSCKTWQKFISKVSEETLKKFLVGINKVAIEARFEDVSKMREDSTVIETNIHYPTNNSLVWDCVKESRRLLSHLKEEIGGLEYRNYMRGAKKTYFKINNTKDADKRKSLFAKQLTVLTKCINQLTDVVEKKDEYSGQNAQADGLLAEIERIVPVMEKVYAMTERHEIYGERVPNDKKVFSIYEEHTAIIVKGSRDVKFGHKVDVVTGKSNIILGVKITEGNPADSTLFKEALDTLVQDYGRVPLSCVTDGGYASKDNQKHAQETGIVNIVFNKIVGSLKNIASSANMETRLKKWRSGIEAVISNLKRGFNIGRCMWKGQKHFAQKVYWSVIGYNIRVMTSLSLEEIEKVEA
jgi:IS5 family transposase